MKKAATFLIVLVITLSLMTGPAAKADSVQLEDAKMSTLVGGNPWCAVGAGVSAGLAIGGTLLTLTGGGAPLGAGIRVVGLAIGLGVYAYC